MDINDFLGKVERRQRKVTHLDIEPVVINEASVSQKKAILNAYNDAEKQEDKDRVVCETVLKSIFGWDQSFSNDQIAMLEEKYSDAVITDLWLCILNFNNIDEQAAERVKKS